MTQPEFEGDGCAGAEGKIMECIDRGVNGLGEASKEAIYWYMESEYGLRHSDIVRKPRDFVKFLNSMFGPGARVIETIIIREIRSTFKLSIQVENLEDAVRQAKVKQE